MTKKKKVAATTGGLVAAITAGYLTFQVPTYQNSSEGLVQKNCTRTLWIATGNIQVRKIGTFDSNIVITPYNMNSVFKARYGVALNEMKGNTVGERYSPEVMDDFFRLADQTTVSILPLFRVRERNAFVEELDAKMVTCDGVNASFDTIFLKSTFVGPPSPTPTPQPTPTQPPIPTPTPTPTQTPPPTGTATCFDTVKKVETTVLSTGKLNVCLWE